MTYAIDWEPAAVDLASRYLAEDPAGLGAVLAVWTPSPSSQDLTLPSCSDRQASFTMRADRYRIVYQVDHATRTISIMRVGRRT